MVILFSIFYKKLIWLFINNAIKLRYRESLLHTIYKKMTTLTSETQMVRIEKIYDTIEKSTDIEKNALFDEATNLYKIEINNESVMSDPTFITKYIRICHIMKNYKMILSVYEYVKKNNMLNKIIGVYITYAGTSMKELFDLSEEVYMILTDMNITSNEIYRNMLEIYVERNDKWDDIEKILVEAEKNSIKHDDLSNIPEVYIKYISCARAYKKIERARIVYNMIIAKGYTDLERLCRYYTGCLISNGKIIEASEIFDSVNKLEFGEDFAEFHGLRGIAAYMSCYKIFNNMKKKSIIIDVGKGKNSPDGSVLRATVLAFCRLHNVHVECVKGNRGNFICTKPLTFRLRDKLPEGLFSGLFVDGTFNSKNVTKMPQDPEKIY
jgi:hypothetical protein